VLSEYVKHHVAEEERPDDGILAKAQQAGIDMSALGRKLQERKQELLMMVASGKLDQPFRAHFILNYLHVRSTKIWIDMTCQNATSAGAS